MEGIWTVSEMKENELNYREALQKHLKLWSAELAKIDYNLERDRIARTSTKKLLVKVMQERREQLKVYIKETQDRLPELWQRTTDLVRLTGGEVINFNAKIK